MHVAERVIGLHAESLMQYHFFSVLMGGLKQNTVPMIYEAGVIDDSI